MRYLMLPLLVMLAGVTFANFLYGPAGMPSSIESNIDNDSTRSDYFSSTDSLYWYNTNYNFYLRQAAGAAGDRDLGLYFVEEDGTEHVIKWDDGLSRWCLSDRATFGSGTELNSGWVHIVNNGGVDNLTLFDNNTKTGLTIDSNTGGAGTIYLGMTGDADPVQITAWKLTPGALVVEAVDATVNTGYWTCTVIHDSIKTAGVAEDVLLLSGFPAKYKILEIFIDVTEGFDDGVAAMSACDISVGWTGAAYTNLMDSETVFTAGQLGDAAAEINYTAIQGGIRASWSSTTDIYARFVATGANLSTLTTGELTVYVQYQAY